MATTWVDGTTPVNAANLNSIESDITSITEKVNGMTDMTNKYRGTPNSSGQISSGTYEIYWGSRTASSSVGRISAILSFVSYQSGGRGMLAISGDMVTRVSVEEIIKGSNFSYETLTAGFGLKVSLNPSSTSGWAVGILMLTGDLPTIEQVED